LDCIARAEKSMNELAQWRPQPAHIEIVHPLGLYMKFPANHHNALALANFGLSCVRELENENAIEDYSI
jgi:hypothetical protein